VTETIHAAGILFVTSDKRSLFLKRSEYGNFPGYYDLPGGKREDGEGAVECAIRECSEEIGFYPSGELFELSRRIKSQEGDGDSPTKIVDYTTFIQEIDEEFVPPKLDFEHLSYKWAKLNDPPEPLHPGLVVTLKKYFADELGIAKLMQEGELTSPQHYANIALFDIRITGTGLSYRSGIKEYVWRDSSIYLNEEFLQRCNGLPVIFEHPGTSTLTTKEYINRNVGSVFIPYIKGNEIWAIVKIWDEHAAKLMEENQLSTSPCVVLSGEDQKVRLQETGSKLLIEGKPKLLDHIAVCFNGVWDKGRPPSGVSTATVGDMVMADDDKAAALEAARKADEQKKADELKPKVDADAKAKADAEEEEKKKADAALNSKLDSVLSALADDAKRRADKQARKDAEKARRDMDEKERADADAKAKADAAAKAKADAEEEEKKKADAKEKADAELRKSVSDIQAAIDAGKPKQMSDADYAAIADTQVRADRIYSMHGGKAGRALDGETLIAYRRRMANGLKEHSPAWKTVDLKVIADDTAFTNIENMIYSDAEQAGLHPAAPAEDFLREIIREDVTGRKISEFVGRPSAWMSQFAAPRRRLAGIRNNNSVNSV
jgi:8-oxo-dGTP pyrophosphatase MutT (NUDIX family)